MAQPRRRDLIGYLHLTRLLPGLDAEPEKARRATRMLQSALRIGELPDEPSLATHRGAIELMKRLRAEFCELCQELVAVGVVAERSTG